MKRNCCQQVLNKKQAQARLQRSGLSRTKIKTQMIQILSKQQRPMSAVEIHEKIGIATCNFSSVWRTLKQFCEKEIAREVNLGEGFFRYEYRPDNQDDDDHHHHVRCRHCGVIQLLEECDLSFYEKKITALGFRDTKHHLEFTGVCSECSNDGS